MPTIDEAGVPGYQAANWWGIAAPAGTPPPVVERLNKEINAILTSDEVKKQFAEQGAVAVPMSAAEFAKFYDTEYEKWGKVVKAAEHQGELAAVALEVVAHRERLLHPARRKVVLDHLRHRLEHLGVVPPLAAPERDDGFERRTAGHRAGDFGHQDCSIVGKVELSARPFPDTVEGLPALGPVLGGTKHRRGDHAPTLIRNCLYRPPLSSCNMSALRTPRLDAARKLRDNEPVTGSTEL